MNSLTLACHDVQSGYIGYHWTKSVTVCAETAGRQNAADGQVQVERQDIRQHVMAQGRFANRAQGGTPEQNKAVVGGAIAMYGTYSVNDTEKTITVRFEGSTFSGFNGTEGKRIITSLSADEIKTTNPATSTGMKAESVWRRAK